MKVIVLCGGRGERFPGSDPKPLNRVCGRMLGEWMTESLLRAYPQLSEIIWILNPRLYHFNIEGEITRWTKGLSNTFIKLPFETRDPSETLELGLAQLSFEGSFICLDNDNIYLDGLTDFDNLTEIQSAILVRRMDPTQRYESRYGFVKIEGDRIIEGKEKILGWGENAYSCGGYWFESLALCRRWLQVQRCKHIDGGERSLLNLIMRYSKATAPVITHHSFPRFPP